MNKIEIKDKELREAAEHGVEAFATLVKDHIAPVSYTHLRAHETGT